MIRKSRRAASNFREAIKQDTQELYRNTRDQAREKMEMANERTKEYIQDNPQKSVAIAAGVGMAAGIIAGAILASRMQRR